MTRPITIMVLALSCTSILGEDAKEFFDSLYDKRIKQVKATVDRADDIALAKEILSAAQSLDRPDVLALMCHSVVDLAQRHSDGLAVATDAMRLLADKVEARRVEARKKLVELLGRQSLSGDAKARQQAGEEMIAVLLQQGDDAAKADNSTEAIAAYRQALSAAMRQKSTSVDEVKARLDAAAHRARIIRRIEQLREKLLADANDSASAEEIIRLYVVDLDNPAEAVKFVDRAKDSKLSILVPLAGKPVASIGENDSLSLGVWYSDLAASVAASSKEPMWRRASAYLTRYLELQPTDQLDRTRAQLLLKPITEALAAIDAERAKAALRNGPAYLISKDGSYTVSSDQGYPPKPALLTGGTGLHDGQFAFCTKLHMPGGAIMIDLGSTKLISRIWIENRRNQNRARAQGMILSLSTTAEQKPTPVWTAEKGDPEWTIELPKSVRARFITIKQAEGNTESLHLAQVKVFGWDE